MEKSETTSSDFMKRIEKQPALLKRFEQHLNIVENSTGDIQKVNETEMRFIKGLREMGNEALTAWGEFGGAGHYMTCLINTKSNFCLSMQSGLSPTLFPFKLFSLAFKLPH